MTAATDLEIDPEVRAAVRGVAHRHYLAVLRPLLDSAARRGDLRPGAGAEAALAILLLVLPHLALAPHVPGLHPVLGMPGRTPAEPVTPVRRLVGVLREAIGPSAVTTGGSL